MSPRGSMDRARSVVSLVSGIVLAACASSAFLGDLPAAEILLDRGSTWRFFRGTAPPSAPDAAKWRQRRFCDGDWETGAASIGYGDDDDATPLLDMQGSYVAVYLRASFDVADPGALTSLVLAADYDDGFVAYLNGREALRVNAGGPGEELGYDGPATGSHEAGRLERFDISPSLGDLRRGENVMAVEVRNAAIDSSDLTFDARLSANEPPPGAPEVLVPFGSRWRFFRGESAPSAPDPTAWRSPAFDDDAWEEGETSIGYGDDDDATVLEGMQGRYLVVYARRAFEIRDLPSVASLSLSVDFDDGFVAYINGREAARMNAGEPGAELGFEDPATDLHEAGILEHLDLAATIPDLVEGENVIAFEVHNQSADSSDLTFDARLTINALPAATFSDSGLDIGGGKAAWADFDGDGFPDVIAGGRVQRNDRGRGFETVAQVGDGIWGDYDNDGDLDIFAYSSRRLFRNDEGTFRDVTDEMLPQMPMVVTRGAAWGDLDGDSYLDLYVGGYEEPGYQPDAILMGDEGRRFRIAWVQSGDVDPARGITAADFDEDGDLDVYVSNYRLEQNQLWRNDGRGRFTNAGPSHGVAGIDDGWSFSYGHTIGSAWGDLDDDRRIDLFVGNFSHPPGHQDRPSFYRNLGPAADYRFEDRSGGAGLAWQESFASPALGDMDNDGDLDLYFTTVYAGDHCVLYENQGGFRFADVTARIDRRLEQTYQSAWADYDNDGDLDLATGGRIFKNSGSLNSWLKIRLRGDGSTVNRDAIAAQVRASVLGRTITRQVESGTGEGNQNDLTLHLGLGGHRGTVPIEILWPDGTVEATRVAANGTVELDYGFSRCSVTRDLPESYEEGSPDRVRVTLSARNIGAATRVTDVFPAGWRIEDGGGGSVVGNAIAFDVSGDGEIAYELLPAGPCASPSFLGDFVGADGCGGEIAGRSSIECLPKRRPIVLLDEGDEITYIRGSARPPADWAAPGFADCEWDDGSLGIGYGDGDDATSLDDMQDGYISVFGRATVDLRDHGLLAREVDRLVLSVRFDDGFAAYLDGEEIGRANLPAGRIDESAPATVTVSDAPEACDVHDPPAGCAVIEVPVDLLLDGENVLGFSVHNFDLSSSDLSFIPTLTAHVRRAPREAFRRGDADSSGKREITDAIFVLNYLFLGGAEPECPDAADADDDGSLNVTDAIAILSALFLGGTIPPPGPECGPDPSEDSLESCVSESC